MRNLYCHFDIAAFLANSCGRLKNYIAFFSQGNWGVIPIKAGCFATDEAAKLAQIINEKTYSDYRWEKLKGLLTTWMNLISGPVLVSHDNDLMEIFRHSQATQQIANNLFSPDTNEPLEFQTVLTGWPIECYISRQKHDTTCRICRWVAKIWNHTMWYLWV